MKEKELRPKENGNQDAAKSRGTKDAAYRAPRLHVAGKTVDLLRGGNAGSLEDFAKRFKSRDSG